MSDFKYIPIDCKSRLRFLAIKGKLFSVNFFKAGFRMGCGVRLYLSSSGFGCTTIGLHSDPHETAAFQKYVRRYSVSTN